MNLHEDDNYRKRMAAAELIEEQMIEEREVAYREVIDYLDVEMEKNPRITVVQLVASAREFFVG